MERILIPWKVGGGNIVIEEVGGSIKLSSDSINNNIERQQNVRFFTLKGNAEKIISVIQKGKRLLLRDSATLQLRDSEGKLLTALK